MWGKFRFNSLRNGDIMMTSPISSGRTTSMFRISEISTRPGAVFGLAGSRRLVIRSETDLVTPPTILLGRPSFASIIGSRFYVG